MTDLERLPTTDSGSITKEHAMAWLNSLSTPTDDDVVNSITAKPYDYEGSTYGSEISTVRVTGKPEFLETLAGLLTMFLETEAGNTRLNINLQQIKDQDTGELTDQYALYLGAAERGGNRKKDGRDAVPKDLDSILGR